MIFDVVVSRKSEVVMQVEANSIEEAKEAAMSNPTSAGSITETVAVYHRHDEAGGLGSSDSPRR